MTQTTFASRIMLILAPIAKSKAARAALGLLIGAQHIVFWLLASSNGLHWWRGPQPASFDRSLLILLIALSSLATLFYGFIAIVFWRWLGRASPKHKFTYALLPLLFGLNVLWGCEALQNRSAAGLAVSIASLWVLYVLVRHAIFVFLEWPSERKTAG